MKLKHLLVFGSLALVGLAGCKKSNGNKPANKRDTTVYVSGNSQLGAIVWTNGSVKVLPSPTGFGTTKAITTSGSDVYIVGSSMLNGGINTAVYWKNNVVTRLSDGSTDPELKINAEGNAIAVSGNDVYIAGIISPNGAPNAVYWKNGVLNNLANAASFSSSEALGIAVNGANVYVCGNIVKSGRQSQAVYWKNGVLNEITDGSAPAYAVAISVKNNSVHMAYNVYTPNSLAVASYYWKDGISSQPSNPYAYTSLNALAVDSARVYLAGNAQMGIQLVPVLWKNNAIETLPTIYTYSKTESIALIGNNVYVAGWDGEPVYWKNGVLVKLKSPTDYQTSGISVVAH